MRIITRNILVGVVSLIPVAAVGQSASSKPATYITKEEVDIVNKQPGGDRQIKVVDIGSEHFAVGVVHRGMTGAPATGGGAGAAACDGPGSGTVRRTGRGSAAGGNSQRPHPRPADRGLLHRVWWRHHGDRRTHRQRPALGAQLCGHDRTEWALMQRSRCRPGRRHKGREGRGHHHHPRRYAARLGEHPRSCGLPQLPSVGSTPDGRVRAPVDQEVAPTD